jgi:hypothetical protein
VADNIAVTPGVGATVATDERTIASTTVQVQRVSEIGSTTIATGQPAPTTTSAQLVAARDTRKRITLVNQGAANVYVGTGTVTTTGGFLIAPGAALTLYVTSAINARTDAGTGAIHYIEEYDA